MFRLRVALVLAAIVPLSAFAQRHGRADSVQNYSPKPRNPILNVNYQFTKTWSYVRLSDLLKMKRVAIDVFDSKLNQINHYEGVALNQLAPGSSSHRVDIFRNSWAFRDRLAVSSMDIGMQSDMIVADTGRLEGCGASP